MIALTKLIVKVPSLANNGCFLRYQRSGRDTISSSMKSARMNVEDIQAEPEAMEDMRREVQAQYAVVKAKRRSAGDFHL